MDKRIRADWPEDQLMLSSERGASLYTSSYAGVSIPPFLGTSYPASLATDSFGNSTGFYPHTASTSGSYESLPASTISTNQLYEESSNESSVLSGSVFTDTFGSSSVTSAGQDDMSDMSSRKASLSSIGDGPLPSNPVQSPDYEESVTMVTASAWPSASSSAIQPTITPGFRYGTSTSSNALPPASIYSSAGINAGPSPSVDPYTYSKSVQMITPANLSSLQINGPAHHMLPGSTMSMSVPTTTSSSYASPPLYASGGIAETMSLQAPKTKSATKSRSSTTGATRRAKFRRSRTGCMVCRKRKVKCDQDGQPCKQCRVGKRECHYEDNPSKRKRFSKSKSDSDSARKERDSSGDEDSLLMDVDVDGGMLRPETLLSSAVRQKKDFVPVLSQSVKMDNEEETRRAREAEEEIKKTSDALFAQHTNFDLVEGDEEIDGKSRVSGIKREDNVGTFPLHYPDPSETSIPWTGRSDPSASMTNDEWSTDTPSTGPSSLRTIDEDPLQFVSLTEGTNGTLEKGSSSPFHTFLDLDDESDHPSAAISTVPEEMSWYRQPQGANDSCLGVDLAMTDNLLKQE